ncbi:hypothetical protein [Salmonella enterica]|uniref:hypothetical protein n=1 Tax=Salmonella enterica TaxID=28901 RepID=UPI001FF49283|nr:hypothetical protein [Salmonella enterica]MCJ9858641.1 hypothetical protein [Salmonella enterica subsp. enterica serovar Kentucky]
MGSCAAPSAKGDDKFITTDYLQQCHIIRFCDEKHKTLWIALFLVEVKNNRFLSQNYILKNSKKAV